MTPALAERVTSFAALKRAIRVGTRITLTHHSGYGPGETLAWGNGTITLPLTRTVAIVQTNAIAFHAPDVKGGHVWLYWPKANGMTVDGHTFSVEGARGPMSYVIEG